MLPALMAAAHMDLSLVNCPVENVCQSLFARTIEKRRTVVLVARSNSVPHDGIAHYDQELEIMGMQHGVVGGGHGPSSSMVRQN